MASYKYTLNGAFLEITCTDSQQIHVDEERIPEVHDHPDGYKRYYVQQFNESKLSKEWRKKLGKDLAIMFLLKPKSRNSLYPVILLLSGFHWQPPQLTTPWPNSPEATSFSAIRRESTMMSIALMPIYTVCAFLLTHTHCWHYSLPTDDQHKYRSPAEFLPHAAWLIAGKPPGRCWCKYCNTGRRKLSQTKLNQKFKDGYKAEVDKRRKEEYQASKAQKPYTPDDQPLEKVFLKRAHGPG